MVCDSHGGAARRRSTVVPAQSLEASDDDEPGVCLQWMQELLETPHDPRRNTMPDEATPVPTRRSTMMRSIIPVLLVVPRSPAPAVRTTTTAPRASATIASSSKTRSRTFVTSTSSTTASMRWTRRWNRACRRRRPRGVQGGPRTEVDALKTSVETLHASVASAETPADKATALVSGLDDISAAWEPLTTASGSECDVDAAWRRPRLTPPIPRLTIATLTSWRWPHPRPFIRRPES